MRQSWRQYPLNWLRHHGLVILAYLLTTLVMTYPIITNLDGSWLAKRDIDTFVKIWDIWWLKQQAIPGESLVYTDLLFHPEGLDLSFHSISWTVAVGSWLLAFVVDQIVAYNLTILFAVFTTALAAYLLIYTLLRDRAAAWLGGLIYSFAPYHIAHTAGHPDLVHLAPIPLAVLLIIIAIANSSMMAAAGSALMIGLAAYTSLYIMDFALLTTLPVLVYLALFKNRWHDGRFWQIILFFGALTLLFLAPRLVPIFRSPEALAFAIESKYEASIKQTDLLAFIVPSQFNPIFAPFVTGKADSFKMNEDWPAYLGVIPLLLSAVALTWKKRRSEVLFWFVMGLVFALLSLGPILRFNGQVYEAIRLPANYLTWFPPVRAVARPDYFVLALLLPLAVCAAYGFSRILEALAEHKITKSGLVLGLSLLLLFEYWNGPYPGIPTTVNPFYRQLAGEEDDFALIELPMGRNESKSYLYYQTVHQKPIVEGLSGRIPADAYQYIAGNALLARWRHSVPLNCSEGVPEAIQAALAQLEASGFRYVIVHHEEDGAMLDVYADYLTAPPVYQDSELAAYLLSDIRTNFSCP